MTPAVPPRDPKRESLAERIFQGALLVVAVALLARGARSWAKRTPLGEAPDFEAVFAANAPDPNQASVRLSDLRGRAVVLDFWATWCGPCQAQSPIVDNIASRFKDSGLIVLGINTSDPKGLTAAFSNKKKLHFPMIYDEGNSIASKYGVESLPTVIVVSKDGKISAIKQGLTAQSDLEQAVREVL